MPDKIPPKIITGISNAEIASLEAFNISNNVARFSFLG